MKNEFPDLIPVLICVIAVTVVIYGLIYCGYTLALTQGTK